MGVLIAAVIVAWTWMLAGLLVLYRQQRSWPHGANALTAISVLLLWPYWLVRCGVLGYCEIIPNRAVAASRRGRMSR